MAAGLSRPAGSLDVDSALLPYRKPLDQRTAAHLLRRAGFGGSAAEIAHFATMSPAFAAETLVHFPDTSALPQPDDVYDAAADVFALRGVDPTTRRQTLMDLRKRMRASILSMQQWWLNRMLLTPAPLQEKMTLFFHGHFTTAAIQKGAWPSYIYAQNQLFRENALGNLRALTLAVSKDPAMLLYLDNASNTKVHPNENYARELMELFTLGHGNYTESDIRESARAFTGWTVNRLMGSFTVNSRTHDDDSKTFLGQTGNFDGSDIVDIIYRQPACSRFWAQSLLNAFVYNDPEPALVDATAGLIQKNHFNLAPVMTTLLQSNVFYSERAYRALVKSPTEFIVGTYKAFGLTQMQPSALRAMSQMGQILFYPPNVAGWPGGENWMTSQTLIARQNFVAALVNSPMMSNMNWLEEAATDAPSASRMLVDRLLQSDAPHQAYEQLVSYLNGKDTSALGTFSNENFEERVRGAAYLTMAMPAYQLS